VVDGDGCIHPAERSQIRGERARREDDEKSPLTVGGRYVFSLRSMIRSTGTRALEEE
jgi:hypothetical protein